MRAAEFILDLFFPKNCVGCGADDTWLCETCRKKIIFRKTQLCPSCKKISDLGKFCKNCKKGDLAGLLVATYYEPPIDLLIQQYKYNFIKDLAGILADFILPLAAELKNNKKEIVIVFVPLHKSRQRWRGFNQAEEIAKILAKRLSLPLADCLIRIKKIKPQVELKREARLKNPVGAFKIKNPEAIRGKNILLLDDIATTLSTLEEVAKVLKAAGAKSVWGLVVARGK